MKKQTYLKIIQVIHLIYLQVIQRESILKEITQGKIKIEVYTSRELMINMVKARIIKTNIGTKIINIRLEMIGITERTKISEKPKTETTEMTKRPETIENTEMTEIQERTETETTKMMTMKREATTIVNVTEKPSMNKNHTTTMTTRATTRTRRQTSIHQAVKKDKKMKTQTCHIDSLPNHL